MKHYIIDGNNLIGKISSLKKLHKKNKRQSAENLAFILGIFFSRKKSKVSLHFDGFESEKINAGGIKIFYSAKQTADERIKIEIEKSRNPRNIILVTSDNNLAEFGSVCSCRVIRGEDFSKLLFSDSAKDEEKSRIDEINNQQEFKKLFGIE